MSATTSGALVLVALLLVVIAAFVWSLVAGLIALALALVWSARRLTS